MKIHCNYCGKKIFTQKMGKRFCNGFCGGKFRKEFLKGIKKKGIYKEVGK